MISAMVIALLIGATWSSQNSQAKELGQTKTNPTSEQTITTTDAPSLPSYILAGGQNGSWFTPSQYPELYRTSFTNNETTTVSLSTAPDPGAVWTGGWNGSNWLITGWGSGSQGLNPYFDFYDSQAQAQVNSSNYAQASAAEGEWTGGDIFSATWNGSTWLLTGMGSGPLYPGDASTNHYSMAFLTSNNTFIDLSQSIPNNRDGILYASGWNGADWLVGGGYYGFNEGVLFSVSPDGSITDIGSLIAEWVPNFNSVQSIAWNGTDWLIGGVGYLAEYNPTTGAVYDLTGALDLALGTDDSLGNPQTNSVNSIVWTDKAWMIAGGVPVAYMGTESQTAWVTSLDPQSGEFSDLTSQVIPSSLLTGNLMSGILSLACNNLGCVLGGFAGNNPVLIWYNGSTSTNLSDTIPSGEMTYVQWVGVSDVAAVITGSAIHSLQPGPRILPI
jgi:hypothetical protein